ncbi:hypothetical protein PRUB_b0614 [Pseudoalteromonas rubra]|uniref:Uncharacterized protein n=1 Tax=Pseudoalteromonas rubra TaxID=43658 RepID=A0A8T0C086_9GAMM|nr:hypothetical protein PRUB_b0614 [Pseudoalteromonas rubra]
MRLPSVIYKEVILQHFSIENKAVQKNLYKIGTKLVCFMLNCC